MGGILGQASKTFFNKKQSDTRLRISTQAIKYASGLLAKRLQQSQTEGHKAANIYDLEKKKSDHTIYIYKWKRKLASLQMCPKRKTGYRVAQPKHGAETKEKTRVSWRPWCCTDWNDAEECYCTVYTPLARTRNSNASPPPLRGY